MSEQRQQTLAMAAGFEKHAKRTRRAEFLSQMEVVVPWRELVAEIEPFYPIVDATIIAAPSSTKNQRQQRDPEMHQTKKGNEWHFGMKAHVGMDAETKLVHTVVATAANAWTASAGR